MKNYFDGYYLKHQKGDQTLCLIVGKSNSGKFIQVITEDFSDQIPLTDGNVFSKKGIILDVQTPKLSMTGKIRYGALTPIKYDIMGPFQFFPMECSHGIVSMYHRLEGKVRLNGEVIDFTGGKGYIEKDSGCSFPSEYVWVQANDFQKPCAVMAAVASIPFYGLNFRGCICIIQYQGQEYRLATYLGVRVVQCTRNRIVLKQGKYRLDIQIKESSGHLLDAPENGEMIRCIRESAACFAEFRFYLRERIIFHLSTHYASFEYEMKHV